MLNEEITREEFGQVVERTCYIGQRKEAKMHAQVVIGPDQVGLVRGVQGMGGKVRIWHISSQASRASSLVVGQLARLASSHEDHGAAMNWTI